MRLLWVKNNEQLEVLTTMPPDWHVDLQERPSLLWVDVNQRQETEQVEQLLTEQFGFHPLAIDDALRETHMPKVDDWESYLYLVLKDIVYDVENHTILLPELDIFLGKQFLVTSHSGDVPVIDKVWLACQQNNRWLLRGADHVLYRLIDEMVNNYTNVLEQLESDILQLESQIFTDPTAELLEELTTYKRTILQIRRILAPQREVVNKLARNPYAIISTKDQVYFRDVYDHMVRLYNLSDSVGDLLMGSMEIYLSVVNNRMNDIMKTLTIITTLFMPLTFITGFFGMNFFQATLNTRIFTGGEMLGVTLLVMVLLPLIMYRWMRQHAWM